MTKEKLKHKAIKLEANRISLVKIGGKYGTAADALEDVCKSDDGLSDYEFKKFSEFVKEFKERQKSFYEESRKIGKSLEKIQESCDHTTPAGADALEYEGHDSHKDYYKCTICGHGVSV